MVPGVSQEVNWARGGERGEEDLAENAMLKQRGRQNVTNWDTNNHTLYRYVCI